MPVKVLDNECDRATRRECEQVDRQRGSGSIFAQLR